eukprot:TRINITY_DN24416_c0_g1_i2.p1 TRINITY_DN24416_c0_g1~~TRINITY_DN24416_c0_g1_i2.p1  ORF type:complete len:421 (-),score=100.17 TRINITY_DN24416_c0_g1_i2:53-1315(-)
MCIFCEKAKGELAGGLTTAQKREAEGCAALQERRVRTTILTGFLGAGKTTFLNYVLKSLGHGKRIAVVQNEFGSVSVDDQLMLVERSAAEVVVMPNGCLCCRVRGDLVDALKRLAERPEALAEATVGTSSSSSAVTPRLDSLLIECSGLSEVLPVAQTFFADPFVQASFKLDSVVCVCDASNFEALEGGSVGSEGTAGQEVARLLREQLAISDVCLLNKCDLVDSSQRDQVARRIRAVNPASRVVPCRQGKVNLGQVLKVDSFSLDGAISLDAHFLAGNDGAISGHGEGHEGGHGHSHEDQSSSHAHAHSSMSSLGLEMPGAIERSSLEAWLKAVVERLGNDLIRLKGVLLSHAAEGERLIVQGVGGHIEIGEVAASQVENAANSSRLVVIGRVSDWTLRKELRESFLALAQTQGADAKM